MTTGFLQARPSASKDAGPLHRSEPRVCPLPPAPQAVPPSAALTPRRAAGTSPRSSRKTSACAGAEGDGSSPGSRCCPPRWRRKDLWGGAQKNHKLGTDTSPLAPTSQPALLFSCGRLVSGGLGALRVPTSRVSEEHEGPGGSAREGGTQGLRISEALGF